MDLLGNKFLIFLLCDEHYAVSVHSIREVIKMIDITDVPKAPPFIKGVINLRGKIIPVVDLRNKFGLKENPYGEKSCIIIMDIQQEEKCRQMGVIVDTVLEVSNISDDQIDSPPEFNRNNQMEFLYGVAKSEEKVIWLINLDKIISCDELVILNKINKEN